jgi:hypothetical protein
MEKSRMGERGEAQMRALSAGMAAKQSLGLAVGVLLLGAGLGADAAWARSEGPVFTLRSGDFACELPGNALTKAGLHQAAEDFSILHGSIYRNAQGTGAYLASGDEIRMTTGPKAGERYRRISENFLRKLASDGRDSDLRCIRRVLNNN